MDRLPYDATTEEEVIQYFKTRQLQIASSGIHWDNKLYKNQYGYSAKLLDLHTNKTYDSFYVLLQDRKKGYSHKLIDSLGEIITINDCGVIAFLEKMGKQFKVMYGDFDTPEYQRIEKIYGNGKAQRTQMFFMNHIDEGIIILQKLNKSAAAKAGFCLHPLTQMDKELSENLHILAKEADPYYLSLSLEYRNIANQYLSRRSIQSLDDIVLSPIVEVNDMLIADKIQNYKDFLLYHKGTHPRTNELDAYFNNWLDKLDCRDCFNWFIEYSKQFNQPVEIIHI